VGDAAYRLEEILANLGCIVVRWRPDGTLSYLNDRARRQLDEDALNPRACDLLGCDEAKLERILADLAQRAEVEHTAETDGLVLHWAHRALHDRDGELVEVVSTGSDVTPYHQLARSLAVSERTFSELADNLEQCVWIKDPTSATTGKMAYMSPAFERIFGIPQEQLHGNPDGIFDLVHSEDLPGFREAISNQFERDYDIEYRVVHPDGSVHWLWSRAAPVRDAEGRIRKLVGITEDITARKEAENRIRELNAELERMVRREQELSRTDELTGLGNRHRYVEEADKLLKIIRRQAHKTGQPRFLAAFQLDLDHLKEINDKQGHAAGDACLRALADVLRGTVREVDVPVRLGGDEFLVLLPNTAAVEARHVAERVKLALERTRVELPDGDVIPSLSASIGVSAINGLDDEASVEKLYEEVDQALYTAKETGRNRVVLA
jgi:diguanylate cyclase (GGDEF)-like protein/PAS domain S-box-containing protein